MEIATCGWLGPILDEIEFQFAFRGDITWNYIFKAIDCFDFISLTEEQQ